MIGILDSGVGGLSIYREINKRFPNAGIIYFADKLHFPYGEKTDEQLLPIIRAATQTLVESGAEVVVFGCNSATVATISSLRVEFKIPIIGIEPAVKQAARITKNGKIGVLATQRTTEDHDGESLAPDCTLCKAHHAALVSKIENDFENIDDGTLRDAIELFIKADVDTIVLGCTHYHFLKERLEEMYPNLVFVDPTEAVVSHLAEVVRENNIEIVGGNDIFLCSADCKGFSNSLETLLGIKNAAIREV